MTWTDLDSVDWLRGNLRAFPRNQSCGTYLRDQLANMARLWLALPYRRTAADAAKSHP